tara:strand:- start:359 stop:1507 length:1149 start_codon:yes stop_codon:yes gene_type:complete
MPVIMTNMRLTGLGVEGTNSATNTYNDVTGSYGVIKNIRLMDGQTELTSLRDAHRYLGFKNLQLSNSKNESVGRYISNHSLGFYVAQDTLNAGSVRNPQPNFVENDNTALGHLDLRQALPLLNSLRSLNNKVFPKLRLVIEYEENTFMFQNDNTANNTARPILIVDEMVDEGVANSEISNFPSNVTWLEIEHDSFQLSPPDFTSSDHVTQSLTQRVNGFNNKNLQRLLVLKNVASENDPSFISANQVIGTGNMTSIAFFKQKINYVVNGKNILTGNGGETPHKRLALMSDTWGDLNIIPLSYLNGQDMGDIDEGTAFQSQFSYDGIYVGENVSDLQINLERVCISNVGGGDSLDIADSIINLYGEVIKTLNTKGSDYVIGYA